MLLVPALLGGCTASDSETAPRQTIPPAEASEAPPAPFVDGSEAAGLDFTYVNGMSGKLFFVEMIGGGGALFDYDDDGDLDLYAVQGHLLDPAWSGPDASTPSDRLFRNDLVETGTLHFIDVTEAAGLRATGYGMGAATGDYNNDGFVDLYVLNWGPNQLWRNNGDGSFTDVTEAAGTGDPGWSTGAAFLDANRDGHLDLMVVNYDEYSLELDHPCYGPSGRQDYCGPDAYPSAQDRFFRNRGDGTFEDASFPMRLTRTYGPALGVVSADFNNDGWPDLFVANDGHENQLWINQAGRHFENQAIMGGVAVNAAGAAEASMGVNAADFDNDGDDDLFMTHLSKETNTLYVNDGDALFEDRTRQAGLGLPSRLYTAFGVAPLDYDNDGWLDLLIANGEVKVIPDQIDRGEALPLRQPNQLFRNLSQGRFEETTPADDGLFSRAEVSRGIAYGDLDNDGDTDAVLFNNDGPMRLLRNEVGQRRSWLGLHLRGAAPRQDALGARVALLRSGTAPLWRRVHTDGSYASAHDPRVLFGLGTTTTYDAVRVFWPSGKIEQWNGLDLNRYHTLVEGEGTAVEEAL